MARSVLGLGIMFQDTVAANEQLAIESATVFDLEMNEC